MGAWEMSSSRRANSEGAERGGVRKAWPLLPVVTILILLPILFTTVGCTWVADSSSSTLLTTTSTARITTSSSLTATAATDTRPWGFSSADLSVAESLYARQIGLRLYMLIDSAWTLDAAAVKSLLNGNVEDVDDTKLQNMASLAFFTYIEADRTSAPTSRLQPMHTAFKEVMYPYAKTLVDLDLAVYERDSVRASALVANEIVALEGVIDFVGQLLACGTIEVPPLPSKEKLTSEEQAYVLAILRIGADLSGPMTEAQQVVEAGGSPQQLALQLASINAAVLEAQAEWQTKVPPNEGFMEIHMQWTWMLGYAAVGLGSLSDPGEDERSCIADSRTLHRLSGVYNSAVFNAVEPLL
jgi:hypothetical protein